MIFFSPEIMEPNLVNRLLSWREGLPAAPFRAHVQITRRCNLACKMCWQPGSRDRAPNEFTLAMMDRFIREAAELGVEEWNLIGGEPLLRQELVAHSIKQIRRLGMNGDLSTNGTLFTEDLIDLLIDSGWKHIRFSIDSPDERDHDYIRGKAGALRKTLEAIELIAAKRYSARSPFLEIMMVLSKRNYHSLQAMVSLCRDLGVGRLIVQPMSLLVEAESAQVPDLSELDQVNAAIEEAASLADAAQLQHNLRDLKEKQLILDTGQIDTLLLNDLEPSADFLSTPCFDPWFVIALRSNGQLGPCDRFEDAMMGDARLCRSLGEGPLADIIEGPFFSSLRSRLLARELPSICRDCCVCKFLHIRFLRMQTLLAAQDYEAAEALARHLLTKNPDNALLHFMLAHSLYGRKLFSEALAAYERAQAINPNLAWFPKGECLKHLGLLDEAVTALTKSLDLLPERGNAWFSIGEILYEQGRPAYETYFYQALNHGCSPDARAVIERIMIEAGE